MNSYVRCRTVASLAVVAGTFLLVACAASPRTRPLAIGPANSGPESVEGVRRQLQGKWTLVSLETFSAAGETTALKATGEMLYDEYGNLVLRGALTDAAPGELGSVLRYSGRAVIDVPNRRLVLQDLKGQGADALPAVVTADLARYYEFDGGVLKLTVKDDSGRPKATVTWKKAQ